MGAQARTWTTAEGPGAHVGALQRAHGPQQKNRARTWGPCSAHVAPLQRGPGAPNAGLVIWTGDSEAPRGMRTPVVGRGGRPLPHQPPVVGVARAVLRVMPCFQREVSHAGGALGLFRERSGVLKGIPPLCKRYNACEVWYRCENSPLARRPGFRCSRARWFHCGTRILMDGHCAFRVPGADQRRRIPLPGCAGRWAGRARSYHERPRSQRPGRPAAPDDRADRPPAPPLIPPGSSRGIGAGNRLRLAPIGAG